MFTFGQSPCASPVERQATNAKSTNTDISDDIAILLENLLNDGSQAAWTLEGGATFTENIDGTTHLQGTITQSGNYLPSRRMALDIIFDGKSFAPDINGPFNQTGVPTDSWSYYTSLTGTLTGLDELAGGELSLVSHTRPFQVGIGANQSINAEDQVANGAEGEFEWTIVTQPTVSSLQFTDYIQGTTNTDITILLSGIPSVPCSLYNPCNNDVEAPVFTTKCPTSIFKDVSNIEGNCWAANWVEPVATDNCTTATLTSNYVSGDCFPVGLTVITYTARDEKGNSTECSFAVLLNKSTSCSVSNNNITKSCVNNIPVLTGTSLPTYEYLWLQSTDGCPNQPSQAIPGATEQNYTLPNRVTTTTYFIRYARPVGCPTWGVGNRSNCIMVNANECAPVVSCTVAGNTITKSCVNNIPVLTGSALPNHEYLWLQSTKSCPAQLNQAIAGATAQNYTLPSRVTTTTYFIRYARPVGCLVWDTINASNCITVLANECAPINCTVSGNTISKSCVNNLPVLTGSALANYEYQWLQSTTGCPTQSNQAIAGATGQNYNLPSRVTVMTYFIRCARPIGCTVWGPLNESNCINVAANECAPINCTVSGNTISKSCVNNLPVLTGSALANYEYQWLKSTAGCPTQANQAIAGATGQNYNLPSRVTVTTYFVRCGRPIGCTVWGPANESNCLTVIPTDCQPATTCSINFSSTKSYRIISKKSGKALDVSGNGMNNDCPIIQWNYNGTANQQWRFFSLGSGYFKVMVRSSSKYLACHYTTNSASVYQYDYYSGGYKDWKIECVGTTGYYRLIHRASGKVLDVTGASTANGAKMNIYPWTGADNQLFRIEEVTPAVLSASASVLAMNTTVESDRVRLTWLTNTGYDNDFYTVEKMNTINR